MLDKVIFISFCLIFFLVPLVWSPLNFELFEYNKMMLTYFLTVIITAAWLLKMVNQKSLIFKRTILDIPLLLFLSANILSTIFSIDVYTSLWGYYSRSNGGLLSTISYLILYWAFVSNISKEQVFKLLKLAILAGILISIWAIWEHFGVSISCVILRGEFNDSCWVQAVQARVFATLGQPNWLAAYLAMLIFPTIYFLLTAKGRIQLITYYLLLITLYAAFTFTFSRGATLGLAAGVLVLIPLPIKKPELRNITIIIFIIFIFINLSFGSALTRFQFSNLLTKSPQQLESNRTSQVAAISQLEEGGSESGKIRLIVWQGALQIFRHYPIFGSGVETFAYSYYLYRPAAHNLVSEWDFLYNKAHNEFLNYLATTGIIGFTTYLIIIITFITIILRAPGKNRLLSITILASYISYLVQNFFSFSVVIIALFFYLFPALAFVATDSTATFHLPSSKFQLLPSILYRRSSLTRALQICLVLIAGYLLLTLTRYWIADTLFAKGEAASEGGNPGQAYNYLNSASSLNPGQPYYQSELAYAAAASALALDQQAATLSAELKDQAITGQAQVLEQNPNNTGFWRSAIKTYFELSGLDNAYFQKTIDTINHTITLAPTDPKLYYNKAVILGQANRNDEAITALDQAIKLKPDYTDAYYALALFLFDKGQTEEAVKDLNIVLKLSPNDPDALSKLNDWGKQGIATKSGTK